MQSKIFYIQDAEIGRFEYLHRFPESRRIGSGEDTLTNPYAKRLGRISSDEVQQATARVSDCVVNDSTHLTVVFRSYVLDHSKGDECVEAATNIAIVILNKLDLGREALFRRFCPRKHNLFVRNVECLDPHTIMFGHIQRQCAPATTSLDHGLTRLQPKLLADQIELCSLGFFQSCRALGKIRAGVYHLGVEPELVEICGEVVMMMDVFVRTLH